MLRFGRMPHPHTGSRSHPPRHLSLWILQMLGNKVAAGAIGLRPRGAFVAAHGIGHSKPMATTWVASPSPIPTHKVKSQQEETSSQWQRPPPGLMEITRPLCGDDLPHEVMGIPLELANVQDPIWIVGSTKFSARLFQDAVSGSN